MCNNRRFSKPQNVDSEKRTRIGKREWKREEERGREREREGERQVVGEVLWGAVGWKGTKILVCAH